MSQIYCGNNAQDSDLLNGNKVLGTRYKCMRKGIGVGLNSPRDPKFAEAYAAIDTRRIYCGDKPDLPSEYDSMGNLPMCLQKGVGIGKRINAGNITTREASSFNTSIETKHRKSEFYILIFFAIAMILFMYLFIKKPSFVTDKRNDNVKIINWYKFISVYIPMISFVGITLFLVRIFKNK
jgi:hypothetical protein